MRTALRRLTSAGRPTRIGLPLVPLAAAAVVAFTAAPASAALPSGAGWHGSWNYYLSNAFEVDGDLPGVRFDGFASDNGGSGVFAGEIRDTAADGRCGLVRVFDGTGLIVEKGACGDGIIGTLPNTPYQGRLSVQLLRKVFDTGRFDMAFDLVKPSSAGDAGMRQVGVGTEWRYTSATAFRYEITRPGVEVTGTGSHAGGETRTVGGKVTRTLSSAECAQGTIAGSGTSPTNVCFPTVSANLPTVTLGGQLTVKGCATITNATRCLEVVIPRPA